MERFENFDREPAYKTLQAATYEEAGACIFQGNRLFSGHKKVGSEGPKLASERGCVPEMIRGMKVVACGIKK